MGIKDAGYRYAMIVEQISRPQSLVSVAFLRKSHYNVARRDFTSIGRHLYPTSETGSHDIVLGCSSLGWCLSLGILMKSVTLDTKLVQRR